MKRWKDPKLQGDTIQKRCQAYHLKPKNENDTFPNGYLEFMSDDDLLEWDEFCWAKFPYSANNKHLEITNELIKRDIESFPNSEDANKYSELFLNYNDTNRINVWKQLYKFKNANIELRIALIKHMSQYFKISVSEEKLLTERRAKAVYGSLIAHIIKSFKHLCHDINSENYHLFNITLDMFNLIRNDLDISEEDQVYITIALSN